MQVGAQVITRDMMPSYDNYAQNPTHLYQLKQERLQNLLGQINVQGMQQGNLGMQPVQQSERWSNGNQ